MIFSKKLIYVSILISFFSYSSALSDYFKPAEVRSVNKFVSATSESVKVETIVKGFAANDPYQLKNIDIPKNRMVSHLKTMGNLVKSNVWYASWFAGMAAMGWAIDELTNQVTKNKVFTTYSGFTGSFNSPYQPYAEGELGALVKVVVSQCSASGYLNCATNGVLSSAPPPWSKPENFIYTVTFNHPANQSSMSRDILFIVKTTESNIVGTEPVTDNNLFDNFNNGLLRDPENSKNAFLDANGDPYPNLFPQTEYIPELSQEDQELLKKYLEGALPTTHPEYARIAALAQALKDGKTQKEINELNENLKKPLTQAQLEETLKKRDAQNDIDSKNVNVDSITNSDTKKELDDAYKKLKDRIDNPSLLPQLPDLPAVKALKLPSYTTCRSITVSIFNSSLTFPNSDQCKKLEDVKKGLGYFLYIMTALGIIFELFRRVE